MKLNLTEYGTFVRKYYEVENRPERFGQFFCNTFNVTDSVLFYSTNHEFMVGHIMDNYLDLEANYDEPDTGQDDETGPYGRNS